MLLGAAECIICDTRGIRSAERRIDAGVWISMKDTDIQQLLARLRELHKKCGPDEPWRIEKEPHNYPDGTTHFNHVRQTAHANGEPLAVTIASHVTPDLAELLVLMRNNLPALIRLARLGSDVQR
jgi:hypothetical protein